MRQRAGTDRARARAAHALMTGALIGSVIAAGCRSAPPVEAEAEVEVSVVQVGFDTAVGAPVVVLESADARRLPIWIGAGEADAIARELQGVVVPRPLTHDLLLDVLESLRSELALVRITELREQTFYAVLELRRGGERTEVDCRPSDAIALALRAGSPIVVTRSLLERTAPAAERRSAGAVGRARRTPADPARARARLTKFRAVA